MAGIPPKPAGTRWRWSHLRVEVQGDFRRQFGAPEVQIRQASAVPPVPEHLMVIGPVAEVVELEAESGAGKAVRPDLGVLAMASLRMGAPLLRQVLSDPAVPPGKGVLTVADDLEWLVPPGVPAGAVVEPEHHQKEALEEQVAISADRVHLQPPRLGAVGSPSGHVVLAPALAWDQRVVLGGIVAALRVVPDLGQPVLGCPPTGVPPDELVQDVVVHLAPCGSAVRHQRHGVAGVEEIEAAPGRHWWIAAVVPVVVRTPVALPAVGCRGLPVDVAQPSQIAIRQRTQVLSHRSSSTAGEAASARGVGRRVVLLEVVIER